jgi:hypothetical protein
MKINPSLKTFKLCTLAPLGIAIVAALVTQPVRAAVIIPPVINTLVITENSSTSLTATYSNGTATAFKLPIIGEEVWQILLPGNASFNQIAVSWTEPENPGQVNQLSSVGSSAAFLKSDTTTSGAAVPNGTKIDNLGTDILNGGTISVTFFDNANDRPSVGVPDGGSSFGLLGLSLIALLGATRLRQFRLA